jgi:hypothetical protein
VNVDRRSVLDTALGLSGKNLDIYVTKEGMAFHESDGTWWPLDDNDELRSDWNPPRD